MIPQLWTAKLLRLPSLSHLILNLLKWVEELVEVIPSSVAPVVTDLNPPYLDIDEEQEFEKCRIPWGCSG